MGLAASQARLLTITARIHDNEFQAEDIMNKKVALSTQEDHLYEEYMDALDAKKLQVAIENNDGTLNYVDATFASVCGFNKNRAGTFALTNPRTGNMVVEDEVYDQYKIFEGRDKYAFAMAMLGMGENNGYGDHRISSIQIGINDRGETDPDGNYSFEFINKETNKKNFCILMNDAEAAVYENHQEDLNDKMEQFKESLKTGDAEQVQKGIDQFRNALYKYSKEIFEGMAEYSGNEDLQDPEYYDKAEFNYYVKLFEGIEAAGGCEKLSEFSDGSATDNEWFNNVVQTGTLLLNEYSNNRSDKGWNVINTGSVPNNNVKEVSDSVAIKKAELKYEHELGKIKEVDKQYDRDLKKLETERTALTTEMDSIKKVKDENIERTFGIFS